LPFIVPSLVANGRTRVDQETTFASCGLAIERNFECFVDPENRVFESNEANNVLSRKLRAPTDVPDLRITNNSAAPVPHVIGRRAVFVRGTQYQLAVEVGNGGYGWGPNVAVQFEAHCPQGRLAPQQVMLDAPIEPSGKRWSPPIVFYLDPATMPGSCSFLWKVDPGNSIREWDERESSNTMRTTVTIH
jgi:hypothetical protein